jgi:Domain of unknown function (DUF4136)
MRLLSASAASGIAVTLALTLTGCASQPQIHSDYDKTVNASQYRTYGFAEKSGQNYLTLTEKTIRNDVSQQMTNRGYSQSTKPDLLVYLTTKKEQQIHVEGSPALIGWGGYGGWAGYDQTVWTTEEGTLTVDVVDAGKKQLVWRGTVSQTLPSSDDALSADKLNSAVSQLFTHYPWTAGK